MAAISDWRNWKAGRKTVFQTDEFDGCSRIEGVITEVCEDHLICEADGLHLWIDDDTVYQFS